MPYFSGAMLVFGEGSLAPLGSLAASKVSLTHQDHSRSIIGLQFGTGARTALVKGLPSASRALQQVGVRYFDSSP